MNMQLGETIWFKFGRLAWMISEERQKFTRVMFWNGRYYDNLYPTNWPWYKKVWPIINFLFNPTP